MIPDFSDPEKKAAWDICAKITNTGLVDVYPEWPPWLHLLGSAKGNMAAGMTKQLSWRVPLQSGQASLVCVDFWHTQELIELNGISPDDPVQAAIRTEAGYSFLSDPTNFPFTMKIADDQA